MKITFLYDRIALAGMMGTGKTTVARILADWLDWELIDTDKIIEEKIGKSVRQIFAEKGEDYFRSLEADLVKKIASRKHCVIATGGGMVIPEENRTLLANGTLMVHLYSPVEELARRLERYTDRPLLLEGETLEILRKIYQTRAPIYEGLPVQISTNGKSPLIVAQEILFYLLHAYKKLSTNSDHVVHAGANLLQHFVSIIEELSPPLPLFVVADEQVWSDIGQAFFEQFEKQSDGKFAIDPILLPGQEASKSIDTALLLWKKLIASGADRTSCVIVLGGGVVGDVGGFVASTLFRGVRLIQIPTTLLAQIDSAIGGKTGVNLDGTKNMVGTFYPASHVLVDSLFLLSLPDRELRSGLAEMVKTALLGDADLFSFLEEYAEKLLDKKLAILTEAVSRTAAVKVRIIEEDLLERSGKRILLNLGHTFGHAVEALSEYRLRHGEAVAIGLVLACKLSVKMGIASPELTQRVTDLLTRFQLPITLPELSWNAILEKIGKDKKRTGQVLRFVFPVGIGHAEARPVPSEETLRLIFDS